MDNFDSVLPGVLVAQRSTQGRDYSPNKSLNHLLLRLISSFRRVEISSFRRFEISRQTNAKADDSKLSSPNHGLWTPNEDINQKNI